MLNDVNYQANYKKIGTIIPDIYPEFPNLYVNDFETAILNNEACFVLEIETIPYTLFNKDNIIVFELCVSADFKKISVATVFYEVFNSTYEINSKIFSAPSRLELSLLIDHLVSLSTKSEVLSELHFDNFKAEDAIHKVSSVVRHLMPAIKELRRQSH
jgi:hypothetical protein